MEKDGGQDDKLLLSVVGIILFVAIAVILVWAFTKDNKLEEEPKKDDNPIVEPSDDDKDDTNKIIDNPIVVVPKEEKLEEKKNDEVVSIIWSISDELVLKSYIGHKITVNPQIQVNGETQVAYVKIEREVQANTWEELTFTNDVFIPTLAGNYRYVYIYNNETKIINFVIESEIVTLVSNTLNVANGFDRVVKQNQALLSLTSTNDVHTINVKGHLKTNEDENDSLRKPIGLLIDLSGRVSNVTSISASIDPNDGIYVSNIDTEDFGADPNNGVILVWLDADKFIHNSQTTIVVNIDGQDFSFEVVINNWQISASVQKDVVAGELVTLDSDVIVNDIDKTAAIEIQQYTINGWETIGTTSYTPVLNETYRYVYTYKGEQKIFNVNVLEEFTLGNNSEVIDKDSLTGNVDPNYGEFETQDRYNVIVDNLGKVTVTFANNMFEIKVNDTLVAHGDASRSLRIPLGIIVDLTDNFDTVTDISSNTNGIYVDMSGTEPWGADTPNGLILVWIDFNEFEFDAIYNINLRVTGSKYSLTVEEDKVFNIQFIDERP